MATTVAVLEAALHADTKKFDSAMGKSESKMQKLGKVAGIAGLAIAGGLAVAFKVGFDEMVASQKVMGQTEAVIESTGGAANVTAKHVDDLAQELLKLSGVDDELIASSENVLLTFTNIRNEAGKGKDIFDQATRATLDMSTALGLDLNNAALQVGKALNDPVKGMTKLQRSGVTFSDAQEKVIKHLVKTGDTAGAQKVILEELNKEFGGSAKAAGETLPAQLNKAKEAFADVAAELVEQLLPAFELVLDKVKVMLDYLKEHPEVAKGAVIGLAVLSAALLVASAAATLLNLAILANPFVLAGAVIVAYIALVVLLARKFDFVRRHWQLFLIVLGLGPVIVATVVKAIIRHWDSIKPVLQSVKDKAVAVFNGIKAVVGPIVEAIRRDITAKINGAKSVFNTLKSVGVGAFNAIRGAIERVRGPIDSLISAVQSLIGWLGRIDMPSFPDPTPGFDVPGVPVFQHGGVMPGPRGRHSLAYVAGGETILPTHRGGGAGGVTIVVQNHGLISSPDQVVNLLRNAVAKWERSNGKAAFG